MAKKKETAFKERAKADLGTLPHTWFEKIQQVAIRGTPDFLICIRGRFIAIELKKDAYEHPDKLQTWKLSEIEDAGGIALVAHPGNWDEIFEFLRGLACGKSKKLLDFSHCH